MRLFHCLLIFHDLLALAYSFSCPGSDGYFPNPSDCSSFYQCVSWIVYKQDCPSGLRYNYGGNYCDWPQNVKCYEELPTTTSTKSSATSSATTKTSTWKTSISSTSTTTKHQDGTDTTIKSTTQNQPKTTNEQTTTEEGTSISQEELICSYQEDEPISTEVISQRSTTCMFPASIVDRVEPGRKENPANVKIVEAILSEEVFYTAFPSANIAYTYNNFLKAIATFPSVCKIEEHCKQELGNMFAHFQQETAGLFYIEEINKFPYCSQWTPWVFKNFPCSPGQHYYGRGAKQLSWNYNYGAFSQAMYGDPKILLDNPDLVATTWLNFASGIWFFVTPQPPKPSMLDIVIGNWQPNGVEFAGHILPGLGATTMVINGAKECGQNPENPTASLNRQRYYTSFAQALGLDISGEKLDCMDMVPFSTGGSANPAIYWDPDYGCQLVNWQTAFSALVDGNYQRCLASK